ncbi:uncharacterized protein RJT21DRAFT_34186 [Scheffersomyces amazonensis]|uniref:uncharacterized protein n=1 Tax=Scheffersomyces amazonensis TaxID=1078765 RepID=UPI00315D52AD
MAGTRRSSRANKGQHTKRLLDEVYEVTTQSDSENEGDKDIKEIGYRKKKIRRAGGKEEVDEEYQESEDNKKTPQTEESEVRCTPCGTDNSNYDEENDKGGTFVLCEKCNTWQHARCMGYRTSKDIPEKHICNICLAELKKVDSSLIIREKLKDDHRVSTALAFYNYFKKSFPADYDKSNEEKEKQASDWALEIEDIIFTTYAAKLYIAEGRRILFLLKKYFMKDILKGTITLDQVVKKTPKEINQEIERVEALNHSNIKNIILTENDSRDIIRRTHKGDIIRENENESQDSIDISIATKKVDHRRFSVDENEITTKPRIVADTEQVSAYNNINPRLEEDDEDEENAYEEQVEEDNDENTESTKDETSRQNSTESKSSVESSDLEHVNDIIDDKALDQIIGHEPEIPIKTAPIWKGTIKFPDFAEFQGSASYYTSTRSKNLSTSIAICSDIFTNSTYTVMGRLDRSTADGYLDKIMKSRDLYFVEIKSIYDDDADFSRLYSYLLIQNKVGVLSGKPSFVKDSYLVPIDFRDSRMPRYIREHKKDMRIGLFAIFVVKSEYVPRVPQVTTTSTTTTTATNGAHAHIDYDEGYDPTRPSTLHY